MLRNLGSLPNVVAYTWACVCVVRNGDNLGVCCKAGSRRGVVSRFWGIMLACVIDNYAGTKSTRFPC